MICKKKLPLIVMIVMLLMTKTFSQSMPSKIDSLFSGCNSNYIPVATDSDFRLDRTEEVIKK